MRRMILKVFAVVGRTTRPIAAGSAGVLLRYRCQPVVVLRFEQLCECGRDDREQEMSGATCRTSEIKIRYLRADWKDRTVPFPRLEQ